VTEFIKTLKGTPAFEPVATAVRDAQYSKSPPSPIVVKTEGWGKSLDLTALQARLNQLCLGGTSR
jgi:hypothetical protein